MKFYHISPEKNIQSILRYGLRTGQKGTLSRSQEKSSSRRISIGATEAECWVQVDLNLFMEDSASTENINWALFELTLPNGWPVAQDYAGYLYTTKMIPPNQIRLLYKDSEQLGRVFRCEEAQVVM